MRGRWVAVLQAILAHLHFVVAESGCSVGMYLSAGRCYTCTNAPKHAIYSSTSSVLANYCLWECEPGFQKSTDGLACIQNCGIGYYYRVAWEICWPCDSPALNSYFYSNGGTSNLGCSWDCNSGYKKVSGSCVIETSNCNVGFYSPSAGYCTPCTNRPSNSDYTSAGSKTSTCAWECSFGYRKIQSVCFKDPSDAYIEANKAKTVNPTGPIVVGVVGGLLLLSIILAVTLFPAKPSNSELPSSQESCTCVTTYKARASMLRSGFILAAIVLSLSTAADRQAFSCNFGGSLTLLGSALAIGFIGSIALYSQSSCGCALCCVCPSFGCNRTNQATSAIGISLTCWTVSLVISLWCMILVGRFKDVSSQSLSCEGGLYLVPSGLISFGGILMSAALLLQGHFVTLVPEAIAYHRSVTQQQPVQTDFSVGTMVINVEGKEVDAFSISPQNDAIAVFDQPSEPNFMLPTPPTAEAPAYHSHITPT